VVERAVLISDEDVITVDDLLLDLPGAVAPWTERTRSHAPSSGDGMPAAVEVAEPVLAVAEPAGLAEPTPADDEILSIDEMKRRAAEKALESCGGNVDRAAAELGIGRATMYRLIKKYGLGENAG
jgi:transcriptional regulator of acetoin/glycerol metabolism